MNSYFFFGANTIWARESDDSSRIESHRNIPHSVKLLKIGFLCTIHNSNLERKCYWITLKLKSALMVAGKKDNIIRVIMAKSHFCASFSRSYQMYQMLSRYAPSSCVYRVVHMLRCALVFPFHFSKVFFFCSFIHSPFFEFCIHAVSIGGCWWNFVDQWETQSHMLICCISNSGCSKCNV